MNKLNIKTVLKQKICLACYSKMSLYGRSTVPDEMNRHVWQTEFVFRNQQDSGVLC